MRVPFDGRGARQSSSSGTGTQRNCRPDLLVGTRFRLSFWGKAIDASSATNGSKTRAYSRSPTGFGEGKSPAPGYLHAAKCRSRSRQRVRPSVRGAVSVMLTPAPLPSLLSGVPGKAVTVKEMGAVAPRGRGPFLVRKLPAIGQSATAIGQSGNQAIGNQAIGGLPYFWKRSLIASVRSFSTVAPSRSTARVLSCL